jgi:mannose-6-phosphate isomerase class I
MSRVSNYEKLPTISVPLTQKLAWQGWCEIVEVLRGKISQGARRLAIECYPGVYENEIAQVMTEGLSECKVLRTTDALKAPHEIEALVADELTADPVFGRMTGFVIDDFFDPPRVNCLRQKACQGNRAVITVGTGSTLIEPNPDVLILADLARWTIQQRQRAGSIGNLGADNLKASPSLKYKRGFFLDWRVADRIKRKILHKIDYLLDTNDAAVAKLVDGDAFRDALALTVCRPFRVVPFFDPGPWGGQRMREVCELDQNAVNYAWCFDCVPEENSILYEFNGIRIEVPALNLVLCHPRALLGEAVHGRFGTEFPIRFDWLDTVQGGNLSLQVHPLTEYIIEKFGMAYTQDESYYLLDAAEDACVYLGLRQNVDRANMLRDLSRAQSDGMWFDAEQYVNKWPARKHDHFLIPAGTIHCSGANSMVLEISATPYIFTFKLWDWGRLGLDGHPRPIHFEHGIANIQWERDTDWVRQNLINRVQEVATGNGWREERTGLHEREFIETRRHWFSGISHRATRGGVQVLNLVEGDKILVESPSQAFAPFEIHYAETFIVPASVPEYTIRPVGNTPAKQYATICASVRTSA